MQDRVWQYISEEMIANKLKISRTPIRESLIALNKEGLLEKTGEYARSGIDLMKIRTDIAVVPFSGN